MLHTGQALEPRRRGWRTDERGNVPFMRLGSHDLQHEDAGEGILWGVALGAVLWALILLTVVTALR
jgi:hypothetical protein